MDPVIDRRCYQNRFDFSIADGYFPEVRNKVIRMPIRERSSLLNEFQGDRCGVFVRDIEDRDRLSVYGIVRDGRCARLSPVLDRFSVCIGECFQPSFFPTWAGIHVRVGLVRGTRIVKRDIVGMFLAEHVPPEDDRLTKPAPAYISFVSEFSGFSAHSVNGYRFGLLRNPCWFR